MVWCIVVSLVACIHSRDKNIYSPTATLSLASPLRIRRGCRHCAAAACHGRVPPPPPHRRQRLAARQGPTRGGCRRLAAACNGRVLPPPSHRRQRRHHRAARQGPPLLPLGRGWWRCPLIRTLLTRKHDCFHFPSDVVFLLLVSQSQKHTVPSIIFSQICIKLNLNICFFSSFECTIFRQKSVDLSTNHKTSIQLDLKSIQCREWFLVKYKLKPGHNAYFRLTNIQSSDRNL